jgi:hypothetical protein
MDQNQKPMSTQTIKSILLLAGSFTFAFLLAEMVHETGHYLAHLVYGNSGAGVHLDPFGGSRITGIDSLSSQGIGVTSLAGPLFDFVVGITTTLVVWRFKRPPLLPLLLWGPVAMIQEGVNLSLGLLSPGSDAVWIAALLLPQPVVLLIGLTLLAGGIATIPLLLPLAGIHPDDPVRSQFLIVLLGMGSLMLIRFGHSLLMTPESMAENLFPLVFALLLSAVIVILHQPLARIAGKWAAQPLSQLAWSSVVFTWVLGGSVFLFQTLALK